jgi:hypothetical protein
MSSAKENLLANVNAVVEEIENCEDVFEWINDQLSIETVMKSPQGDFMGVEILCTYGGPTVRVDTRWGKVEGWWGSDHFSVSVDCEEINGALEDLY